MNDIYLIEVGSKKYVLRLSRADKNLTLTESSFLFELTWLEFLNDHQSPVSFPIRRIDKQLFGIIEAFEGPRYATLFSFAEGTTDINADQAFILGRSLAQLHIISDNFKTDLERDHLDIDQLIDEPLTQNDLRQIKGERAQDSEQVGGKIKRANLIRRYDKRNLWDNCR